MAGILANSPAKTLAIETAFLHFAGMRKLDQAIINVALDNARRRLSRGDSAEDAAAHATPGVWAEYRPAVLRLLRRDALRTDDGEA